MAFQNSHAFLGGVPGGWSVADKTDPLVVEAVKFALQSAFPTNFMTLDFEILQANQQVIFLDTEKLFLTYLFLGCCWNELRFYCSHQ